MIDSDWDRRHATPALPTHDPVAMDALLNTYATGTAPGVWHTATGADLVGSNGRKLIVRDDPDGVYVGGVLVSSADDLRDFAAVLLGMAAERAVAELAAGA